MIVLAFDCDGTLEGGDPPGPVKTAWLEKLRTTDGVVVVIVSGSTHRPTGFQEINQWDRLTCLNKTREEWPEAALCLYISDNNDENFAMQAGFVHVHPKNFRLPEEAVKP